MSRLSNWPSRKLQIGIIAALFFGAAAQVWMPPFTRRGRAEKLYTDSWFVKGGRAKGPPEKADPAVRRLVKALELDPGNSLYEQALVWQYPRKDLPQLLKTRRLGPEARRLAAGRICEYEIERITEGNPGDVPDFDRPVQQQTLARLDRLAQADPENSLPHYRKACMLDEMGRFDEAIAEVKAGNRLPTNRFYFPEVSKRVAGTNMWLVAVATGTPFADYARLKRLAMNIVERANRLLRKGKAGEAESILREGCLIGVNLGASDPPSYMHTLVGYAIFAISSTQLRPISKDLRMTDELRTVNGADCAFRRTLDTCRTEVVSEDPLMAANRMHALPVIILAMMIGVPLVGTAVALLWIWPLFVRRRVSQAAVTISPWGQGWLAKALAVFYMPWFLILTGALIIIPERVADVTNGYLFDAVSPDVINSVAWLNGLVFLTVILHVLHRRHDEATGERTSIWRFMFRSTAATKAWTRKYILAAFGAQMLFLVCCFMVMTILYEPIVGGNPWEVERFRIADMSRERAVAGRLAADLKRASVPLREIGDNMPAEIEEAGR